MITEIILIVLTLVIFTGIVYWIVARPMRQLQKTVDELQNVSNATTNLLERSQQETANLSRALRSTNQQGQWGELQLLRVVEMAGMQRYCDFETQVSVQGKDGPQRPDMIIRLHNERVIVVDAKAPYATYIDAMAITDDAARMNGLKSYTKRIQFHIHDLAKKEYWQEFQATPPLVVLFLPSEAMLRAALEVEPSLFDIGTRQNVLLASPITLIALLKTVAYGWSQENRARSVQQIVNESQSLYKELSALRTQWDIFRGTLNRTITEYNSLTKAYMTKVFPIVQRIRDLDGTLGKDDSILQVTELQRVLEKVGIEEVGAMDEGILEGINRKTTGI